MELDPKCITIFSKSNCPFCDKAKMFFEEKKLDVEIIMLEPSMEDYETKRDWLKSTTGQSTFPFIFIGTDFVGGFMELLRADRTLKLNEMCAKIGLTMEYDF